jgi:alpha-glucoside transport system substrate-binding protein
MKHLTARVPFKGLLVVLALIVVGGCGPATAAPLGGSVSVLGTWDGAEREAFMAMIRPFEQRTGITVAYHSTRDLSGRLWKGVATGDVPDVAGLPGPGEMRELARVGALVDLHEVIDVARYKGETAPAFIQLGTVDDRLAGVFIKSTVKGLIWFNPHMYTLGAPASWDDLVRKAGISARGETRPWCVGLESGEATGWPATDWIEDILLRQAGADAYDDWISGKLSWTSPEVRRAFETFGEIFAGDGVHGGRAAAIATNFGDAGTPLFSDPPGCLFLHQASFMPAFFRGNSGARDGEYDFFPFPALEADAPTSLIAAGDLMGMFNDTPQARALMNYLVSAEAQSVLVAKGGGLSPNSGVTNYPDDITRREAELLQTAEIVRFDASDMMPDAVNEAFWQATVSFVRDPSRLDEILASVDRAQSLAGGSAPVDGPIGPNSSGPANSGPAASGPEGKAAR